MSTGYGSVVPEVKADEKEIETTSMIIDWKWLGFWVLLVVVVVALIIVAYKVFNKPPVMAPSPPPRLALPPPQSNVEGFLPPESAPAPAQAQAQPNQSTNNKPNEEPTRPDEMQYDKIKRDAEAGGNRFTAAPVQAQGLKATPEEAKASKDAVFYPGGAEEEV